MQASPLSAASPDETAPSPSSSVPSPAGIAPRDIAPAEMAPADMAIEMFRPLAALIALPPAGHAAQPSPSDLSGQISPHEPAHTSIKTGNAAPPPTGAPRRVRPNEPADFYVNVFQDNRRHWLNAESAFDDLAECFQSILDGQRGGTYRYTLHVSCAADGARAVKLDDFEPDARAWAAEGAPQPSLLRRPA